MDEKRFLFFGPFRFDCSRDRLWRDQTAIKLRAKSLAVLRYLVQHQGQVVSRSELLKEVWAGIYVSKTTLRVCVREIRLALGDDVTAPQFIETIGRQGYRFIGQVVSSQSPVASRQKGEDSHQLLETPVKRLTTDHGHLTPYFVGREQELAQLRQWLDLMLAGRPRLIFVTGEAGIGKTTLVNTFLRRAQETEQLWTAHGQCIEQHGVGVPYLALVGALKRLSQETGVERFVQVFAQHAPVWLAQLPTLLSQEQRKDLAPLLNGIPRERLLRELAEALAVLSTVRPIVLVLEDLHWSDVATIEVLDYLARRQEPARLLVLSSYRQASIMIEEHPLRRLVPELFAHNLCEKLQLELLSEEEVSAYIEQRFGNSPLAVELSPLIFQRTDGNALFVVHVIDYLLHQGLIQLGGDQRLTAEMVAAIKTEIPDGLQQLIQKEMEGLSAEEQQVLETASIAGVHFTVAEVAAAENTQEEHVEVVCDGLVRRQRFIAASESDEWPDGTITAGYQFVHTLYRQIVSTRVGLARQARLHRLISERLESAYGTRATEIAGHLAVHFELGRDPRAVYYRRLAAERALRQSAYPEVQLHAEAGLARIATLPDTSERKQLELELHQLMIQTLSVTRNFQEQAVETHLQRAQQLCHELQNYTILVSILVGLIRLYEVRADRRAIVELQKETEQLLESVHEAKLMVQLHTHLNSIAVYQGMHARAEEQYQRVVADYNPQESPDFFLLSFHGDPLAIVSSISGMSCSLAGYLDQGWARAARAIAIAEERRQPVILVYGLFFAAVVRLLRGEYEEAGQFSEKMTALAQKYQFSMYRYGAAVLHGYIAVQRGAVEEGIAHMRTGLLQHRASGVQFYVPLFLSFLAQGYRQQGNIAEALQTVDEALELTATNLDIFWEAELYRLKGELILQQCKVHGSKSKVGNPQSASRNWQLEAETCFLKAIEIARQQGAKLLELRATTSLVQLRQQQRRRRTFRDTQHDMCSKFAAARTMLADIYHWFTEGLDTADLRAAQTLLAE